MVGNGSLRASALRAITTLFAIAILAGASDSGHASFATAFERYNAKDSEAARIEAEPDAERGNPAAQWLLGTIYLLGQGIDAEPETARRWFEKSAESNYPPSQAVLGRMFEEEIGGRQDAAEAHTLYRLSAEQGYADAAYLLGR